MSNPVKLEIGCGPKPPHRADFIGLDRFSLPGVDIVCNLDQEPIPLPDNHVDLVYASHSLEHVGDLDKVLREIWRVCKPGAQLCIVAPYYSNAVNFANPYHFQNFNEHTTRFWTSAKESPIDKSEYALRFAWKQPWGLAHSDYSPERIDFRTLRMELFYYAQYHWLPRDLLIQLRQSRNNVCHSMIYHLMAFKPPMGEADVTCDDAWFYQPPEVESIRKKLAKMRPRALRRALTLLRYRLFA